MHWNYRMMKHTEAISERARGTGITGEVWYAIHSVTYDDDGNIIGWTKVQEHDLGVSVCDPRGDTPEELKSDLELMMLATTKPILDYETGKEV